MRFISGPTTPTDSERYTLQGNWGTSDMLWSNGERVIDFIDEHEFKSDVKRFYNDRDELIAVTYQINEWDVRIVYDLGSCDAGEIIGNCYFNHFGYHEANQDTDQRRELPNVESIIDDVWTEDLREAFNREDSSWFLEVWDADFAVDDRD